MESVTEITVRSFHVDHFGHVNHARYVEFLEEGRWRYIESNGLLMPLHELGSLHVVVELRIRYRKSAGMGEKLLIKTEITSRSDSSFTVGQTLTSSANGAVIAEADITNVFLDPHGKALPISNAVLDAWPDLADVPYCDRCKP